MADDQLMQYFKFNETDLVANRNGFLSEAQAKKLNSRQTGAIQEKRLAVMIAFPLGLLLLGWMGFLIFKDLRPNGVFGTNDVVTILLQGSCGALLLLASAYIFKLSRIRQKYLLKKVEGPINIIKGSHILDGHSYVDYELHIGGEKFKVVSDLGDRMMQGDTYAVYCSVGSVSALREILSVELISKANSTP
jgi:hypothetical protein